MLSRRLGQLRERTPTLLRLVISHQLDAGPFQGALKVVLTRT